MSAVTKPTNIRGSLARGGDHLNTAAIVDGTRLLAKLLY